MSGFTEDEVNKAAGADSENMTLERENRKPFDEDDEEGMDLKARALTKLLKTSSVFVAIMAEKMKEQRKRQQEEARKAEAKRRAAAERQKKPVEPAISTRRETRASQQQSKESEAGTGRKDSLVGLQSSTPTRLPTRARTKKAAGGNSISNYFKKADVEIAEDNPTVQEALAKAADEFEAKPATLGEQDLVATHQPALVTGGKMREYQLEGLEWLKSLWMNGLCGILADEMGLGKTVQAISLIAFFKEHSVSGPFLVAAPLSTVSNWVNEFARWTPGIETVLYHGTKEERAQIRRERMKMQHQKQMDFPVVCTSYEICMNDRKFLANYQWKYIIVDEGHRLKNMNCRLIKELMTYNSANRLLITGTPLQNNIAELWSLLHFLLPEVFNDLDSFQNWFDFSSVLDASGQKDVIERRKKNLVSTMHAILKPFLLRRVKTDVETELPKKREYILYAPLTPEQKELYLAIIQGTSRQYLEDRAVERIESRNASVTPSRSHSLKRKANGSGNSTPNKSLKSSRDSTPGTGLTRSVRKRGKQNYREISDREFNAKLRMLENGIEEETPGESEVDESELLEIERAKTMKLAKKEIASKKLQNPLMQARLACNSPHNFYWPWDEESDIDESLVTASGKMLLLDRLVPCLLSKGHKVLIFSQFKTQLDILQDWAYLRNWNCCRIDGAVSQADRQAQINAFNADPDYKIFLLSTRAGGLGINLTAADTVILYDSDWNPQQDLQAQDRAHRIGQTKPVIVYRLATRGTVEQTLLERADSKRRLEKLVIQKGKFKNLFDVPLSEQNEVEELRKILGDDGFQVFDVGAGTRPESLLSKKELEILTDRSEEAYARAEKGLDRSGNAFLAVKSKREGDVTDMLER
ncbi:SNF2 family N-terminal domain containing protein [Coccidioides posadasii C735 delta SOWgp]|uniref:SNF2 family N-terminal domain containing protein n=1 Tax=Coccidioides posadasii (strain C735) TaxID=222929 RepID=C5P6Y9_COCP7|nr:SNF2 family N-terminal domain containing protein [Coccidioides posadasii C735 delta SOWgp]EER27189.1 SNF2 family N-terminal domain containing protein [Coccidioides posadasii C735 delta SOWgp]|eukprot:XP_003069334.1 SNF2 family N-terminal domain containing protein [Coccidioides posadasii C735 delta SOWgp]